MLLDTDIKDDLPFHDYFEYYGPDYKLHLPVSNMENQNRPDYLETVKIQLFEILRYAASQCPRSRGPLGRTAGYPDICPLFLRWEADECRAASFVCVVGT